MFQLHHIDIWVNDVEKSIKFYKALGFKKIRECDNEKENKKIVLMEFNNVLLEMKHHYTSECEHNNVNCKDNKVFGLSVKDIKVAKKFIEDKKLINEEIVIKNGILNEQYFIIHDPNGIAIEIIEGDN